MTDPTDLNSALLEAVRSAYAFTQRYFPFRGRYRVAKYVAKILAGDRDFTVKLAGTRKATVWANYRSVIEREVMVTGVWEPTETALITRLIKPGMNVLDVGAHHGMHSFRLADLVGSGGRVFSIEPNPESIARFRQNLQLNNGCGITLLPFAIDIAAGQATLYANPKEWHNPHGILMEAYFEAVSAQGVKLEPVTVPTRPIDALWRDQMGSTRIDFVKMDIEGFEYRALQSAREMIGTCRPTIMFEYSQYYSSLQNLGWPNFSDLFRELGYIVEDTEGKTVADNARFALGPTDNQNYVAVHSSRALVSALS